QEPPSGLGGPIKQAPLELHPEHGEIQSIELLESSPPLTGVFNPSEGLKIRHTDQQGKGGELAQFDISPPHSVVFHWSEGVMSISQRAARESLRDCALKVRLRGGASRLVVLGERVADYDEPMGLGTGPMRWDAGEVFTQSKRPVFIDRVMATTLMH